MTYYRHIAEQPGAGRLGRHVQHDPRSKAYRVTPAAPQSVRWLRATPILDQGNLGSCTGNAAVGALGSAPFWGTAPATFTGTEKDAVAVYCLATQLDGYDGAYPPEDTGSDGLSAAKACKQDGYISGYQHALSMDDFLSGMQTRPGIIGINWYSSFDEPDADGVVSLPATATIRGGHEIECNQIDVDAELAWCPNSWGTSWGKAGYFAIPFAVLERLFSEDGDATFFTPNTEPAPTPEVTKHFTSADSALLDQWAAARHIGSNRKAARAWKRGT